MSEGEQTIQRYFRRTSDDTLKLEFKRVAKYQPSTRFTVMEFIGIVLCDDSYDKLNREVDLSRDELLKIIDTELRMRVL